MDLSTHQGIRALIDEHGAAAVIEAAGKMLTTNTGAVTRAYVAIDSCRTMEQLEVADRYATLACRCPEGGFHKRQRLILALAAARARRRIADGARVTA